MWLFNEQDRYVLTAMILHACVCFWHGIQTLITSSAREKADVIAISTFIAMYALYNVCFWAKIIFKVRCDHVMYIQGKLSYNYIISFSFLQ